jgi:hypothetical protein
MNKGHCGRKLWFTFSHMPITINTVKPACDESARGRNFSVAGRFLFIQVLIVWILGTPDTQDCKIFPLQTGFCYVQIPFKTGFNVPRTSSEMPCPWLTFKDIFKFIFYVEGCCIMTAKLRDITSGSVKQLISELNNCVLQCTWSLSALMVQRMKLLRIILKISAYT